VPVDLRGAINRTKLAYPLLADGQCVSARKTALERGEKRTVSLHSRPRIFGMNIFRFRLVVLALVVPWLGCGQTVNRGSNG
jgi:hypothetical protein